MTRLTVGELRSTRQRFGLVNLVRQTASAVVARGAKGSAAVEPEPLRGWARLRNWLLRGRAVKQFYVGRGSGGGKVRDGKVWEDVLGFVKRNTAGMPVKKREGT